MADTDKTVLRPTQQRRTQGSGARRAARAATHGLRSVLQHPQAAATGAEGSFAEC
jgi:hypothetical protein